MKIPKTPLVTAGLILGLLGLGNLLKDVSITLSFICGTLAILVFIHLLYSVIIDINGAKDQLNSPLVSSVFTTCYMSGFLGTTYLYSFFKDYTFIHKLAVFIWFFCLVAIIFHMTIFSFKYLKNFSIENVVPSWTVLYIGIAIAGLTAPISGQYWIGKITVIYGFIATCLVLPVVFKRLRLYPLQSLIKPNTSTICAPFSLVSAAYVVVFPNTNLLVLIILLILSQFFYFYIIIQLPKLINRPFSPAFSAFTFPLVISATALKNSMQVWTSFEFLRILLFFEISLATLVVTGVYSGYVYTFFNDLKNQRNSI
ncbi:TDT family transporter [Staphylococcus sp. IVB6238]|uniref:TDT family transporter n=1 Tax=Staphylococcus sp. IVB6238 TaxID=2989770 RepID=UPI0021CE51C8|nr:TDT family transporter [Staphylococcus sp. IVB6238]UXR74677.1 TDT family transporter [Staphylococcus sp. IVB6238]